MPETGNRDPNSNTHTLPSSRNHKQVYQGWGGSRHRTALHCIQQLTLPKVKIAFVFLLFKLWRAGTEVLPISAPTRHYLCNNWGKTSENSLQEGWKIRACNCFTHNNLVMPLFCHCNSLWISPPPSHLLYSVLTPFFGPPLLFSFFLLYFSISFSETMYLDPPSFSSSKKGVCSNS